jgi:ABC-type transporter MlaC component
MPILRSLIACLALAGAVSLVAPGSARADEAAARAVAETLVEDAHGALADTARPEPERMAALRAAIETAFAFDIWEKFLLGDRAKMLSEAQTREFRALLPGFLADLYRNQFGKGLEAKPEIREVREARRDFLVRAAIPRANGKTLPVDWRIRDLGAEKGHKVIDVMVGGTSFLILKRDEFAALLERQGPEALLAFMRENSVGAPAAQ